MSHGLEKNQHGIAGPLFAQSLDAFQLGAGGGGSCVIRRGGVKNWSGQRHCYQQNDFSKMHRNHSISSCSSGNGQKVSGNESNSLSSRILTWMPRILIILLGLMLAARPASAEKIWDKPPRFTPAELRADFKAMYERAPIGHV